MKCCVDYNIIGYLKSIIEVKDMTIDSVLNFCQVCKKYEIDEGVSDYLYYVDNKPFYISPSFKDIKIDVKNPSLNPKFLLFSAPGATGKTSLAKYISHKYNAIYWNLANVKIGTNSFVGSILSAVTAPKYSQFIDDLNKGNVLLVIDAFDEAELVSGRKMIGNFISDINSNLGTHLNPTVILLARTETAQYIASFCAESGISIKHYEIGFFDEQSSKEFILKSIADDNGNNSQPDVECVDKYYRVIKESITEPERESFLGYAPVLEAVSKHIKLWPNRQKLISTLATQDNSVSVIMAIMDELLGREQKDKVVPAFRERCEEKHPEFSRWDDVFSPQEQLVRIVNYLIFSDTKYSVYSLDFLPPQLIDDYQDVLNSFLKQHPFIRNAYDTDLKSEKLDFTGPAFRDYTLAKIFLEVGDEDLADFYFECANSQSYFPSRIFFDCYMEMSKRHVYSNHISHVYNSYKAKSRIMEIPCLQCSETTDESGQVAYLANFSMIESRTEVTTDDIVAEIYIRNDSLHIEHLVNVFIDVPGLALVVGKNGVDARVSNTSVVCKNLKWNSGSVSIESYDSGECLIVANDGFVGNLNTIDIISGKNLKVFAPNINSYHRFVPYKYELESVSGDIDITRFMHALKCILGEFRTHKKDMLAKTIDRIEFVVGSSVVKRKVIDYLKSEGMLFESDHLYKINETKLQEKGISFTALHRMDSRQLLSAYTDFSKWCASN